MTQRLVSTSLIGANLISHREALIAAASRRGLSDIHVFGSVARGEDGPDSDVDLLVVQPPGGKIFDLLRFECEAEDLLGVRVDVGTSETLRSHVRADVLADAVAL